MSLKKQSDIQTAVQKFIEWLNAYGETSFDHQSFFAGPIGKRAKALYYSRPFVGTLAVSPMIFCEAFVPIGRQLFWEKQRFPIADAHYAMGFALLAEKTKESRYYERAVHFLHQLIQSRSPGYKHYCWGYPFDWVTRNGTIPAHTPFITTLPYVYEAFEHVYRLDGKKQWMEVMQSAAEHALNDIRDFEVSPGAYSCGYGPYDDSGGVVNASAYRAFLLTNASILFSDARYGKAGEGNVRFVLNSQQQNGAWPYAVGDVRNFVDHFHTCFVLKALAKIENLTQYPGCYDAIEMGVAYYLKSLIDHNGLPKPFSVAPRLTVYKRELYDYAECINLCLLLKDRIVELNQILEAVILDLMNHWVKSDGSFKSRQLLLGWDNVPMHRWAQSQLFRSLALYLNQEKG